MLQVPLGLVRRKIAKMESTESTNQLIDQGSLSQGDESNSVDGVKTVLLFGKTGSGKSATGNSILGFKGFEASPMFHSTTTCTSKVCHRDDMALKIVDTPDVTERHEEMTADEEVAKWQQETKDGIDALLLVHKLGVRFTDQHERLLGVMENIFGREIYKHTIVVFTYGDQLKEAMEMEGFTFEQYLSSPGLTALMKKVDNRYVIFNNRYEDEDENNKQVQDLLKLINKVSEDTGAPYKLDVGNPHDLLSRLVASLTSKRISPAPQDRGRFSRCCTFVRSICARCWPSSTWGRVYCVSIVGAIVLFTLIGVPVIVVEYSMANRTAEV